MLFFLFIFTVFGNDQQFSVELKPESCSFKDHQQVCKYNITGESNKAFSGKEVKDTTYVITFNNDKDKKVKQTFNFSASVIVGGMGEGISTEVYCYDSKISKPVRMEVNDLGKENAVCTDGNQCYFGRFAYKSGKTCEDIRTAINNVDFINAFNQSRLINHAHHLYCCEDDAGSDDGKWLLYGHYVWQPYTDFKILRHQITATASGKIYDEKGKETSQIKDENIVKNFPTFKRWFMKKGNNNYVTATSGVDGDLPPEEFGVYSGRPSLSKFVIDCVSDSVHKSRNVDIMHNNTATDFKCSADGVPTILKDTETPQKFLSEKKSAFSFGINIPSYEVTFADVCETGYEFKNNKCEKIQAGSGSSNVVILALLVALLLFI